MSGLFGSFNIAKRGIGVAQSTIDVTSHNITNANTPGYSRQRAKIETTRPYGGNGKFDTVVPGQVGTGAQVASIERIRDNFLDYQVRGENSSLGKYDVRANYLHEVENIYNEPSDTGISTLMGKFFDSFQELSKQPQSSNSRTVVAQTTLALTDALNHTYTQLEELQTNAKMNLKNNVTEVNSYLDQINQLNKEIIQVKSSGMMPNDLMDKRDSLLDQLSYKFNISINKSDFEGIDVRPEDANGMKYPNLVNSAPDGEVSRLSFISEIKADPRNPGVHVITYYKEGDTSSGDSIQTLRVNGLSDEDVRNLEASRILWGDANGQAVKGDGYPIGNGQLIDASDLKVFSPTHGEVAGNISVQKDIQNYMDELDSLAKAIAFSVNAVHSGLEEANSGVGNPSKDFMPFFVNSEVASYNSDNLLNNLDETLDSESEISAKNITINKEILDDVMKIKTKTHDCNYAYTNQNDMDGDTDGARALAIASLRDKMIRIQDFGSKINSREDMFKQINGGASFDRLNLSDASSGMTMDSYFKDSIDRLGVQAQEATRMVKNQEDLLGNLEQSRDSISGVSLDEEMANLIQYQHAYSANAKVISTLDELLDVVINGLIR